MWRSSATVFRCQHRRQPETQNCNGQASHPGCSRGQCDRMEISAYNELVLPPGTFFFHATDTGDNHPPDKLLDLAKLYWEGICEALMGCIKLISTEGCLLHVPGSTTF